MDDIDRKLIDLLRVKPRCPARALGDTLGIGESAVASRIKGMVAASQMRVMAMIGMDAIGFQHIVFFKLRVSGVSIDEVAAQIAEIPEVYALTTTMGRFQLVGNMYAKDKHDISQLLDISLGKITGVVDIEASLALETLSYSAHFATLDKLNHLPAWTAFGKTIPNLDKLDNGIVHALQQDGRTSFYELGRLLNKPESTIRSRMQRLQNNETMHIAAVTNNNMIRPGIGAWLSIKVAGGRMAAATRTLQKMPEIRSLALLLGSYNMMAVLMPMPRKDLQEFVFKKIPNVSDIEQSEVAEIIEIAKHDIRVVPFHKSF